MSFGELFVHGSVVAAGLGFIFFAVYPMIALRDKKPKKS